MTGTLIHPHLPGGVDLLWQLETQLTGGIRTADGNRLAGGGDQGHDRTGGRYTRTELARQGKGPVQIGDPLKTGIKRVGHSRTGSQGDCHQQQRTQGRQRLAHGDLGSVQEVCQRLWGALPA